MLWKLSGMRSMCMCLLILLTVLTPCSCSVQHIEGYSLQPWALTSGESSFSSEWFTDWHGSRSPIAGNTNIGWHTFAGRHKPQHRLLDTDYKSLPHASLMGKYNEICGWHTVTAHHELQHFLLNADYENSSYALLMSNTINNWEVPKNIEYELYDLYARLFAPFIHDIYVLDGDMSYIVTFKTVTMFGAFLLISL